MSIEYGSSTRECIERATVGAAELGEDRAARSAGRSVRSIVVGVARARRRSSTAAREATVRQKETMELRLKKAFSDKADEFRKAVQSLLGFRLDFLSSGRVKVTSLYDPDKVYALLFSSAAGGEGTMELLSKADGRNPLDDEVKKIIQFWGAKGCIPGLLASLSLTLFESQE